MRIIWKCRYILCILRLHSVYMKKKAVKLDDTPVRKNIDLPKWAVDEFDEMATVNKNRVKPYIELTLMNLARKYRNAKNKLAQ